jgi:hypothetical protein
VVPNETVWEKTERSNAGNSSGTLGLGMLYIFTPKESRVKFSSDICIKYR